MVLSVTDYLVQGINALLVFLRPWFLHREKGVHAFGEPFVTVVVLGLWRMLYFDPATKNDVPGSGYFASAIFYASIAWGLFRLRWTANTLIG